VRPSTVPRPPPRGARLMRRRVQGDWHGLQARKVADRPMRVFAVLMLLMTAGCSGGGHTATRASTAAAPSTSPVASAPSLGIHKIRHVIIVMQENRSFDSYFGTYPGADGIPMSRGVPAVCVPDQPGKPCIRPFVDHSDVNGGGPHGELAAEHDLDHGRLPPDGATRAAVVRSGARPCVCPKGPGRIDSGRDGIPHRQRPP